MNKKPIIIKHRSSHHAGHSGYSKLIEYLPVDFLPNENYKIPYRIRKTISFFASQKYGIYNSDSVEKEAGLIKSMMTFKHGIAHFLNAERDVRFSTIIKNLRRWSFVATFHKPPDILKKNIQNFKYLSRLDGAIAVSENQVDFLRKSLGINLVSFIPHGVDTDFYTPLNDNCSEKMSCLFVGQHLRDFASLNKCISILTKYNSNFRLKAVLNKKFIHLLPDSPAIEVYEGISDEQLKNLYRSSSVLLLPLIDSTACNSILEALACGLPIVTNSVGGVSSYLNMDCGFILPPGDTRGMAEAVIHLIEDNQLNITMRKACRENSMKFSWPNVAEEVLKFYNQFK